MKYKGDWNQMIPEERNRIEYKMCIPDDLEECVVAFLNYTEGGVIYIGISGKNGEVVGVNELDTGQLKAIDRIKNNILPNPMGLFDVIIEKIDEKEIIKIIVSSGMEKPYYLRKQGMSPKGCYVRVGSSNQQMTTQQIDMMFAKRVHRMLANIKSPSQRLSFLQLEIYYSEKKIKLNAEYLSSFDLIDEEGKLNFVAYLLADENGISIKVAKYAGKNKVNLIENEEYGYRCLITATHRVLEKLRVENRTFTKITPITRLEKKMIDETALREAVINAIVHNDYTNGMAPQIEIYSDRLTITSYGGLPTGLSKKNFFRCRSLPRNRELMRIFKDLGLAESLGSGMDRILDRYDHSIFTFEDNFLITTFPYTDGFVFTEENINTNENENIEIYEGFDEIGNVNGDVNGNVNGNEKSVENATGNAELQDINSQIGNENGNVNGNVNGDVNGDVNGNEKLDDLKKQVLLCVKENPYHTLDQLSKFTRLSKRTLSRQMKKLQSMGLIQRVGSDKVGYWETKIPKNK